MIKQGKSSAAILFIADYHYPKSMPLWNNENLSIAQNIFILQNLAQ
jgi:hypothetical protein